MKTFLSGLGFSGYEARKLLSVYGDRCIEMLQTPSGRESLASEVEASSVRAAHLQFTRIWTGTGLYQITEPMGVPTDAVYNFFCSCGGDDEEGKEPKESLKAALGELYAHPYRLVTDFGAPFPSVNELATRLLPASAKSDGFEYALNEEARVKAAVYSVLTLVECGSEELGRDRFSKTVEEISGSTCLPLEKLITLTQMLIHGVSSDDILSAAKSLHREKKILLSKKLLDGEACTVAYRQNMANMELEAGRILRTRLALSKDSPLAFNDNLYKVIDVSQAALGLYLSHEQVDAVVMALTNRVSVITGGPGTGKTQTEKVLLEAYRRLSDGMPVTLMAPTGQAAKRMSDSTGHTASTLHLALGIMPGETNARRAKMLKRGMIVIDEASMLDASMLRMLLEKSPEDATVVFIGDVDQLPSIGAGNVLVELKKCVPTATLTKIFRQDGDAADIAYNAARIKAGTTQMIEGERFSFVEANGSTEIQKAICDIYAKEAKEHGLEGVVVLSPLRRNTKTGVNKLNVALRRTVSSEKRFLEHNGERFYLKDKVIFLKNRNGLVNGAVGRVSDVRSDSLVCEFGDIQLTLSGSELGWITPAYAETIHKSQGDEYPVVILVADELHRSSKAMTYTAVTRAKERVIVVGSRKAFEDAIKNSKTGRYSCLSAIASS